MIKQKKILTFDELLKFCCDKNFSSFNSKDTGYQLAVQIPTTFEEVENVDENHKGMMKLKFRIFHTNLNRNGSFVPKNAADKAMNTIADRPILAAIHQLDNGEWDFEGHEMEVVTNDDGTEEFKYIESQVGSFSSEPAFWEHDDELDKDYVCAYGYISREYTKAAEIIERKNGTKNSCELCINELSFNAEKKYVELSDFYVNASTLLGSRSDGTEIGEGMLGSRADIADFSVENNSVVDQTQLIKIMQELKESLDNYTNSKKGGHNMFESLLEKYGKTVEEIDFEYEGLTDEELEVAFAEAFSSESDAEDEGDTAEPEAPTSEEFDNAEPESTNDEVGEDDNNSVDEYTVKYSMNYGENTREFSLSLNDKLYAIQALVNDTYGEIDNDWYSCDVFEEDGYVIMHGWNRSFRQNFKCKKKQYSLVGDRIEVYAQWLTEDEISKLDTIKSNYSSIETELAEKSEELKKYEEEPKKLEIINNEDYSQISETEEVIEFSKRESHFNLSVDEVKNKMDELLLAYAKAGNLKFTSNNEVGMKKLPTTNNKSSRYGNLFSK